MFYLVLGYANNVNRISMGVLHTTSSLIMSSFTFCYSLESIEVQLSGVMALVLDFDLALAKQEA